MTDALAFAHQLADAAAEITLAAFRAPLATENKASGTDFDPVTRADREAEAAMRALIEKNFPDHAILGEEYGHKQGTNAGNDYCWILDPIDGTRAFISGSPLWGTLIALTHNDKPILGICDQPYMGERFYSTDTKSFLRHNNKDTQLATSATTKLQEAICATTTPALFENTPAKAAWERVSAHARLARYGGDCYNYALLAAGHIDCVIEQGLRAYDIAALIPLIESAGGVVSDWQGAPLALSALSSMQADETCQALACANPSLQQEILPFLQNES